jgi:hypothetical protein
MMRDNEAKNKLIVVFLFYLSYMSDYYHRADCSKTAAEKVKTAIFRCKLIMPFDGVIDFRVGIL